MQIITPKSLECDAIVPQCLDNQYTSDAVLDRMLCKGVGFDDDEIKELRLEETHAEFIRALLYSSTVVVNRAYLVNSAYLLRELQAHDSAIPKLIRHKAITPYLQREKTLTEESTYAQQREGVERLRQLEEEGLFEGSRCLRFSDDDTVNEDFIEILSSKFRQFSQDLSAVAARKKFVPMANQLYAATLKDQGAVPDEVLGEFRKGLQDVSRYVQDVSPALMDKDIQLGRQHVYERFFIADGEATPGNVAKGFFRNEMNRPSTRMLKKLIDLKYNANLPDMLGRYTLTPANMPGRSVLPFEIPPDSADTGDGLKKLVELKGRIMDQRPTTLPRLRKLDLHHVLAIRELEEWQRFRASQERLLTATHEGLLSSFDNYQRDLLNFQGRLGRWAVHHAADAGNTGSVYKTAMNLTVQVGLVTLFVALDHQGHLLGMNPLDHLGSSAAGLAAEVAWELSKDKVSKLLEENHVTETIKDWTVKLLVEVSDAKTNRFDKDHSYQLELMRSNAKITRGELVDMIQEIQQASKIATTSSTQFAEQSK